MSTKDGTHTGGSLYEAVIKPLYRFIRDQGYKVIDGKFVRREHDHEDIIGYDGDHEDIIGYDDVNQLFWYREAIAHIVLNDKVSMQLIHKSSNLNILL